MKKYLILSLGLLVFINLTTAATSSMVMETNTSETFTLNGTTHKLTLLYIDGGAKVELDGVRNEYPDLLEEGENFTANNVRINALEVTNTFLNFTAESVESDSTNLRTVAFDQVVNISLNEEVTLGSGNGIFSVSELGVVNGRKESSVRYDSDLDTKEMLLTIGQDSHRMISSYSNYHVDLCEIYVENQPKVGSYVFSDTMTCEDLMETQSSDESNDTQSGPTMDKVTLKLDEGWNMVSLPEGTSSGLENTCDLRRFNGEAFWKLNGDSDGWQISSVMSNPMEGHVVYAESSCETDLIPSPDNMQHTVSFSTGWNTVSVPKEMSLSDMNSECDFKGQLWTLGTDTLSWEQMSLTEQLDPTTSYYVKSESECSITY